MLKHRFKTNKQTNWTSFISNQLRIISVTHKISQWQNNCQDGLLTKEEARKKKNYKTVQAGIKLHRGAERKIPQKKNNNNKNPINRKHLHIGEFKASISTSERLFKMTKRESMPSRDPLIFAISDLFKVNWKENQINKCLSCKVFLLRR